MAMDQVIPQLINRYTGKETTGWEVDDKTGATIVYAIKAIFIDGSYYSMETGEKMKFSEGNYIKSLRKKVGHDPIEGVGTGIIVYRKNRNKEIEIMLQLRTDLSQYGLFGGGLELGESYTNCAVREMLQEASLLIREEDFELKDVYAGPKHVTKYPSGDIVFHTVVVYSVEYSKCIAVPAPVDKSETKDIKWISVTQLKKMLKERPRDFFPNNIPILEDIVNKFFKNFANVSA